ncbi:MAG: hypothetical protein A2X36_15350 [Elusimicrobia bacterium GWA2_69_24]|nr:MAG: hypothetical protein A2X36_15350 [Elusimicrobia bacterium GWA2_69_24]
MRRMILLLVSTLFLTVSSAVAQGEFQLPPSLRDNPLILDRPVGQKPSETRLPMLDTLEATRRSRILAPLGNADYQISLELTREEEWVLAVLKEGDNRFELAASFMFIELRKTEVKREFGGAEYRVSLDETGAAETHAVVFQDPIRPLRSMRIPLSVLERAAWDAAAPLPCLNSAWRMAFQIDMWRGAGMRSFMFMHKTDTGVEFYRVGAEAVDWTRSIVRKVGDQKVALRIDLDAGQLVVRPVPAETPEGPLQP